MIINNIIVSIWDIMAHHRRGYGGVISNLMGTVKTVAQ